MKYHQADIVEINFMLPNFQFKPHLAVIVSNDELNEKEDFFFAYAFDLIFDDDSE
jgi:hypothetical protein